MKFLVENKNSTYKVSANKDGVFIEKHAPYDMQDYYYAVTTDNENFKVYRNGKFIKNLDIDEMYIDGDGELNEELLQEVEFQLEMLNHKLKPVIDKS